MVKNLPASARDAGLNSGLGRSLEKGMATHSSILAWEIPWVEEPGDLQSIRLQRVRHDLATKQQYTTQQFNLSLCPQLDYKSLRGRDYFSVFLTASSIAPYISEILNEYLLRELNSCIKTCTYNPFVEGQCLLPLFKWVKIAQEMKLKILATF